jgi:murein DD-endopeptidase MepM/ murein hydrolase activator NlpD
MSIDLQEKTKKIVQIVEEWLGQENAFSTRPIRCTINGITPATYFVTAVKVHKEEYFVQEIFSSEVRGQILYRSWTFRKESYWFVAALEHFSRAVPYTAIRPQMDDFERRLEILLTLRSRSGPYFAETAAAAPSHLSIELPSDSELQRTGIFTRFTRSFARHSVAYTAAAMAAGILLLIGVHILRVEILERKMSTSLREYSAQMDHQVQDFISNTENEILTLINNLHENRKNFKFDRQNAYISVKRMAEELAGYLPARKKAYNLIANNIQQASTYSEVFYEMSRLPTEEYQARIFLATNRQSVIPLSNFKPAFEGMLHPVKLDTEKNDGRGFRITDGYMKRREDPVGTGGVTPHFAVDIINVSNIAYVNHAGEIIREGNPPGDVVAAYEGVVIDHGFNNRYGWYLEIEHPISEAVQKTYPDAQKWSTYYAHLDKDPELQPGDDVEANQFIAPIGDSGKSTGPHLHFEVRVYRPSGRYSDDKMHYDKVNPYPEEKVANE